MALIFYNFFLVLYKIGIRISAIKNQKASLWIIGRKDIFVHLKKWKNDTAPQKIIWVHCASLGEFEQGRPVMDQLKILYPTYTILLTFFSPSGYQIRKNYTGVDAVFYLPLDGKKNAVQFINIVQPSLVIWVKYEYWYYYLTQLKKQKIPLILVSAIFRPRQPFFKWYGSLHKKMLHSFTKIFVQNQASLQLLHKYSLGHNAAVAGDTRFDSVINTEKNKTALPTTIINFCKNSTVIVAGSTWQDDELALVHFAKLHKHIKIIIAPHNVNELRITEIEKIFIPSIRYSAMDTQKANTQVLIIDNIGMLCRLYQIADIAYIGGGFNASGIHNILEAAVYAKPIIFGSVYYKFKEAVDLVAAGGAFSFDTALALEELLITLINNKNSAITAGHICKNYVHQNAGATQKIMEYIKQSVV